MVHADETAPAPVDAARLDDRERARRGARGASLAAGRAGLREGARLPEPVGTDPAGMDAAERERRGIVRLPESLAESVAAFEADPVLGEALGPEVVDTVAAVRRGEIALFEDASPEEVATATRYRH